jgi:hypothetical protein
MGSGRGRTRRAKAATVENLDMVYTDFSRWNDFIQNSVEGESAMFYYDLQARSSTNKEFVEALADELMRDLITVDALALPSGVSAEDIKFTLKRESDPPHKHALFVKAPLLGQAEQLVTRQPTASFKGSSNVAGPSIQLAVYALLGGVAALFSQLHEERANI